MLVAMKEILIDAAQHNCAAKPFYFEALEDFHAAIAVNGKKMRQIIK